MQAESTGARTIICRFGECFRPYLIQPTYLDRYAVPYDLWLVTHVSLAWRTKQAKQWLLSKCLPSTVPPPDDIQPPTRHRPVSPITFASSQPKTGFLNPPESLLPLNGRWHGRGGVGY